MNNPVSVAHSEKRFIWPSKGDGATDIAVSIGAGYVSDPSGEPARDSLLFNMFTPQASSLMKTPNDNSNATTTDSFGFLGKLAMVRWMVENALNCQKLWISFRDSVVGPDVRLEARCHRLNVPFAHKEGFGAIDDVDRIPAMKDEALAFASSPVRFRLCRAPSEVTVVVSMDATKTWEAISGSPRNLKDSTNVAIETSSTQDIAELG